jgi:dTDP-4-dehydrorhamnose 3,5-epimerase-like enzyme
MQKTRLSYIIEIPKIQDEGFLCFAEEKKHIPFPIKRFYYIYDVENGAIRGKHAHKETQQVLFCLKGSIKIILDNGKEKEEIILSNPNQGIFLDKMMWHDMVDFQKDTILLIVASDVYDENDYIRDYDNFISLTKNL